MNTPVYKTEKEKELDKRVENNVKNQIYIEHVFYEKIANYINQLNNSISTDEWIDNIKKERMFKIKDDPYYVFVWEKVPEKENYIYLVSGRAEEEDGLSWKDVFNNESMKVINTRDMISSNQIPIMYNVSITGNHDIKTYEYYWLDPYTDISILKKSYIMYWKHKDGREGSLAIGMNIQNVKSESSYKYIDYIDIPKLVLTSIIIFAITIFIFVLKTKYHQFKAFGLLIAVNLFLLNFINTTESISTTKNEMTKITNINSNILNVSFLSGVNIFVVKTLYENKNDMFNETAFVFAMSMILLLMSSYKETNRNRIEDIIKNRITNQMLFNTSIFFNLLIIINFIIYALFYKK